MFAGKKVIFHNLGSGETSHTFSTPHQSAFATDNLRELNSRGWRRAFVSQTQTVTQTALPDRHLIKRAFPKMSAFLLPL